MHLQDTSEVDGLRELNLSNKVRRLCPLPGPIQCAARVTQRLCRRQYVSELGYVARLANLEELNVSFNDLASVDDLHNNARLERLQVRNNDLQSLRGVEGCPELRQLRAQKNRIARLGALRECVHLEELWIQDNSIRSIHEVADNLAGHRELRQLMVFPNPFCPRDRGEDFNVCRLFLLTKLRSLENLQGQRVSEQERAEADDFFASGEGEQKLKAAIAKTSGSSSGGGRGSSSDRRRSPSPRRGEWTRTVAGGAAPGAHSRTARRQQEEVTPEPRITAPLRRKTSWQEQVLPKDALLQWLNDLLQLEESLDDLVSGAAVCQVMDVLGKAARTSQHQDNPSGFPDVVPMKRVNFRARLEHECVKNYKVLQGIFREFGIEEQPNWSTLAQGRSTELLELLRWTHRFCVEHGLTVSALQHEDGGLKRWVHENHVECLDGQDYDPVRRRPMPKKGKKGLLPSPPAREKAKFSAALALQKGAFKSTERPAHGLHMHLSDTSAGREASAGGQRALSSALSSSRHSASLSPRSTKASQPLWEEPRQQTRQRLVSPYVACPPSSHFTA